MKKKISTLIPIVTILAVVLAVFLVSFLYFRSASDEIYEDSTNQLKETYDIVDRSTRTYIEQKWRILTDWKYDVTDDDFDFERRQKEWRMEDFYFVGTQANGQIPYYSPLTNTTGNFPLDEEWAPLFDSEEKAEKRKIMVGEELGDEKRLTVFAIPIDTSVEPNLPHTFNYDGGSFEYSAIAISFSNDSVAYALNTNPYDGEAYCFVIHSDGRLLFSLEKGGDYTNNYLDMLRLPHWNVDVDAVNQLERNMQEGVSEDLITLSIGDKDYCVYYQSLGYQDYYLFSAVPKEKISSGFLSVQRSTMTALIILFAIVGVGAISFLVYFVYHRNRRVGAEVKYREQIFDVLSNSVNDLFIMLDCETQQVDYVSPNVERLLGIPYNDAVEDIRTLSKCSVNENIVFSKEELSEIPVGESKSWEHQYVHQITGDYRWYKVTIYHMGISGVMKFIIVMSDRTVERQLNRTLQEAFDTAKSANDAKSNFLSNMSHDIRTPLNAILGFAMLLDKDADNSDKVREYTRKITASGHHLLSIINDVLDMSKIESGKTSLNVETFALPKLIEELNIIVMPQAKAKEQNFSIVVKGNPPEKIMGDRLRLNRILMNILSNSVKYTPEGGKIEFIVSNLERPSPQLCKLRFTVRDNGIGMSEEFVTHIFEPFERERTSTVSGIQGTGLGMTITKSLVDLMGGIITVESEMGKGSTFVVELPFQLAEHEEADAWYKGKINRMLVADDEEDICLAVKETMSETDVDVECVFSGADAVESAVKAYEEGRKFDVILLDWKMPGMDGVEAAKRIRERTDRNVSILVLTSYDWADIEEEARRAGIDAFMSKPFFISTFWETIRVLFEKQSGKIVKTATVDENALRGKRFLVVEDNDMNAEILTEMLSMEGAESEVAVNGKAAVEKFLSVEPDRYDMILMDVQMPVMNGYEATRAIRASEHPRATTIPIVAMTANAFADDVRNALDAGMDGHLSKPIDIAKVNELLCKLLKKQDELKGSAQ